MIKTISQTEYYKSNVDQEHIDYVNAIVDELFVASEDSEVYIDDNMKLDPAVIEGAWEFMTALERARVREWTKKTPSTTTDLNNFCFNETFDNIRSMTDVELREFINGVYDAGIEDANNGIHFFNK